MKNKVSIREPKTDVEQVCVHFMWRNSSFC